MAVHVRYPNVVVTRRSAPGATPVDTLPNVGAVRIAFDLHQGYSTADVSLVGGPSYPAATGVAVTYWDWFEIDVGAEEWGQPTSMARRFAGYLLPTDNDLYPAGGTLHLRGPLGVAALVKNGDDTELTDTLRGTAMGGMTARAMVMQVLDYCGLTARYTAANIHGSSRVLGTVNDEGYVWQYGETALAFIQRLDAVEYGQDADLVYGFYTTLETLDGQIYRNLVTVNPQLATPDFTLSELSDYLPGSTKSSHDITQVVNSLYVTGYDDGLPAEWPAYPARFSASSPYLTAPIPNGPDGYPVITDDPKNPLLEMDDEASTTGGTVGLSCEGYARAIMAQRNCEVVRLAWASPHDWLFGIGQIHDVSAPGTYTGVFQAMWLEQLTIEVSEQRVLTQSGSLIARN